MGETTIVNKNINTWLVTSVTEINWDEANYNWDTFYADQYYASYIEAEFGIAVPGPPYGVLWDHAISLTIAFPSGYDYQDQQLGKKEKKRKKIKLIFMIDDLEKVFEKEKNTQVKVEFKQNVENILTEKFGQKIILEDVQIIHR
jgi:hypothetical protein